MATVHKKENEEVVFGLQQEERVLDFNRTSRVPGHCGESLWALMKPKISMQIPALYPFFYIFIIKSLYFTWARDFVMHFKIKL